MRSLAILAIALVAAQPVAARDYATGPVHVMSPWSRALPPVSENGAAYLTLENYAAETDALVAVSSPKATSATLHGHTMEGGVMKMRATGPVEIPPNGTVTFEPGGLHVMLMGLASPLTAGEQFPLRLEFRHAAPVEVMVEVIGIDENPPAAGGHTPHEHGADHGASHDGAAPAGHHAHDTLADMPAGDAPALSLAVEETGDGGYALTLETERFRFARQHADGDHVPGEGHAHLYVDGVKLRRIFGVLDRLAPLEPGVHEIEVGLFTNNHMAYAADGHPVSQRFVVLVAPDGEHLPFGAPVERFALDVRGGKLHEGAGTLQVTQGERVEMHWTVDAPLTLHLHGYDVEARAAPGSPVTIRFGATLAGRFPIEAHGAGHGALAYLEVRPR